MQTRYIRNIPALKEEECRVLQTKRVLVVGCGGLGGHIIDMLCRLGVGALRVVDGDVFEETNLNRQLLSQVPLLGINKARAAADHIRSVNPALETEVVEGFLTAENAADLVRGCHIVMDALDNIPARHILADAAAKAGIPYVYGGIQGWVAQAAVSMPGDGLIRKLLPEGTVIRDNSVLSFTPALCAAMQVSLAAKVLTGRPVQPGTVLYFDLLHQEFETIPMI